MIPYRRLVPLLMVFGIILLSAVGSWIHSTTTTQQSPMIGKTIGYFTIPGYPDASHTLTPGDWKNKITIVNFFASWCEPCNVEHPVLMKLAQGGKVQIIGIAWKDKAENLSDWFAKKGNPYQTIGIDTQGRTTLLFGLSGVPETFIIGRDGKVAYTTRAALTEDIVTREMQPVVQKLQQGYAP